MNILYLHGFGSSGQSSTVEYLKKSLPDHYHIEAPDIPVDPAEALPFLKRLCEEEHFSVIIGTSMGGMYAHQLPADFARICVNPALHLSEISDVMKVGTFDFFQPRKDGQTQYTITEEISKAQDLPVGLYVTEVDMDSPAMAAGLASGDILIQAGETPVTGYRDLINVLMVSEPEDTVRLKLRRSNNGSWNEMQVTVTLAVFKKEN